MQSYPYGLVKTSLLATSLAFCLSACSPAALPTTQDVPVQGSAPALAPGAAPATAPRTYLLAGRATYGAQVMADARVAVYALGVTGKAIAAGRTDSEGRFSFNDIRPGLPLEVVAFKAGHVVASIAFVAGDDYESVSLTQASTLSVGTFADRFRAFGQQAARRDAAAAAGSVADLRKVFGDLTASNEALLAKAAAAKPARSLRAGASTPPGEASSTLPSVIGSLGDNVARLKRRLGSSAAGGIGTAARALRYGLFDIHQPPDPFLLVNVYQASYWSGNKSTLGTGLAPDVVVAIGEPLGLDADSAEDLDPSGVDNLVDQFAQTFDLGLIIAPESEVTGNGDLPPRQQLGGFETFLEGNNQLTEQLEQTIAVIEQLPETVEQQGDESPTTSVPGNDSDPTDPSTSDTAGTGSTSEPTGSSTDDSGSGSSGSSSDGAPSEPAEEAEYVARGGVQSRDGVLSEPDGPAVLRR